MYDSVSPNVKNTWLNNINVNQLCLSLANEHTTITMWDFINNNQHAYLILLSCSRLYWPLYESDLLNQ